MKQRGIIMLLILGSLFGLARVAGSSGSVRLNKVSREEFLKSQVGMDPAVQSLATGLGMAPAGSSDENRAPRFYLSSDQRYGLVEACLASSAHDAGLYIVSPQARIKYYAWYDPTFNAWACAEDCNEDKDCYYEAPGLDPDASIHRLNYHYEINLQGGQNDLELQPKQRIKVLRIQTVDLT